MTRTRLLAVAAALVCCTLAPISVATAQPTGQPTAPPAAPPTAPPTATETPQPAVAETEAVNQPPVAVADRGTVVAGRTVRLDVLANDTDDRLGRPDTEEPHLEIADFDTLGGRVTSDGTTLAFSSRTGDAKQRLTLEYAASDGELTSQPATVTVSVTAAPVPVVRTVSLRTARTVVALRYHSLHGRISPLKPGPANVKVERLVGRRWVKIRADRVDAHGDYAIRFRTNRPVRHTFRAVAYWSDGRRAVSPTLVRTPRALADAHVSGPLTRRAVPHSYRSGCPVSPSGLRRVTINRFTYDGSIARGSLVVRASAVPDLLEVFRNAFSARFRVRTMKPADAFYAGGRRTPAQSDLAAMRADNTSAFNCRPVTGNPYRVSQHSYGNAIDINTVRNPYVVGRRIYPSFARTYLNRRDVRAGMILRNGVVARTMRGNGWPWGARWSSPDYQHFSSNGG